MRRAAKILPAFAALFFLGACATSADAATAAASDDYRWNMHAAEGEAHLMFGVPDSDIVWFGLSCRAGSERVEITQYGGELERGPRLQLASGGARQSLSVRREPNELHEETASAELSAANPVLAAFRATGRLGVAGAADGYSAATPGERAQIARFFKACSA